MERSHVAAAVLMIQLAVVLHTNRLVMFFSSTAFLPDKENGTRLINNSHHVLQSMLPEKRDTQYNLRTRTHDRVLINKTVNLNDCDFMIRMLYRSSY